MWGESILLPPGALWLALSSEGDGPESVDGADAITRRPCVITGEPVKRGKWFGERGLALIHAAGGRGRPEANDGGTEMCCWLARLNGTEILNGANVIPLTLEPRRVLDDLAFLKGFG